MAHWFLTLLSILLPVAALGGGAVAYAQGHDAAAEFMSGAIEELASLAPTEAPDLENLEKGDLCGVAKRQPASVPSGFRIDVRDEDGRFVEQSAARAVAAEALPMIPWSNAPGAEVIEVTVVDADLHFEGDDIAGVACGMSILIEERFLLTSTLPHEIGHVFGLDHEAGSYMQVGRDPDERDSWERWTIQQRIHLLQFQVGGVAWPDRLESDATDPEFHGGDGCGCGMH